jgi:hypothetical protein
MSCVLNMIFHMALPYLNSIFYEQYCLLGRKRVYSDNFGLTACYSMFQQMQEISFLRIFKFLPDW